MRVVLFSSWSPAGGEAASCSEQRELLVRLCLEHLESDPEAVLFTVGIMAVTNWTQQG